MTDATHETTLTVHQFNTGRRYTREGQRIRWAFYCPTPSARVVLFFDRDRFISGAIDVHFGNLVLVDNDWVLRAYDYHFYRDRDYATEYDAMQTLMHADTTDALDLAQGQPVTVEVRS